MDERGVKYHFENAETSYPKNTTVVTETGSNTTHYEDPYVSSWLLKEITSPFSDGVIQFFYDQISLSYELGNSETKNYNYNDNPITPDYNEHGRITETSKTYSAIDITELRPSHIDFPDGTTVQFEYEFSRKDLKGDYAITRITINNNRNFLKYFVFSYDYFESSSSPCYSTINPNQENNDLCKRLRLLSIADSSQSKRNQPYVFTYNSTILPPRISVDQDYWGYSVSRSRGNTTLISKMDMSFVDWQSSVAAVLTGADRTPDPLVSKAGLLEKIIYPTGGFTQFDYENNDAYVATGYYENKQSKSLSIGKTETNGIIKPLDFQNRATDQQVVFFISLTELEARPVPNPGEPQDQFLDALDHCSMSFDIKSTDGTVSEIISGVYANFRDNPDRGYGGARSTFNLPLNKTYIITCHFNENNQCPASTIPFTIDVNYTYYTNKYSKLAGGVRVAKIIDNSIIGNPVIKSYSYKLDNGLSSGNLLVLPNADYYKTSEGMWTPGSIYNPPLFLGYADYLTRTSSLTSSLGSFQGSPVVYTHVTEQRTDINNNSLGKRVYEFTPFDGSGFLTIYPYPPGQIYDWKVGLLTKESIYDNINSTPLVETLYSYNYYNTTLNTPENRSLKVGLVCYDNANTFTLKSYVTLDYYPKIGRAEKISTVRKENMNGLSLNTTTSYEYDPNLFVLRKSITTDSKGIQKEVINHYPQDYPVNTALIDLTSKNIYIPVSTEVWKVINGSRQMIDGNINEFNTFNFVSRLSANYKFRSLSPVSESAIGTFDNHNIYRNSTYFKKELEILKYDPKGNIASFKGKDGIIKNNIWDYNNTYPIAEVINSTYEEIAYTSFETEEPGNWTINATTRIVNDAVTGKQCYRLGDGGIFKYGLTRGKKYIVSYWTRNSGSLGIEGTTGTKGRYVNGWTYYQHLITLPYSYIVVSGSALIDELRLYPADAQMNTYTYEPLIGMTSQCDINNRITYYEYDASGRLKLIRDQDKNILKKFDYVYYNDANASPPQPCQTGGNCSGPGKKCINGYCEQGRRINTSTRLLNNSSWKCTYHFAWSNGDVSEDFNEENSIPCDEIE